jgi:glucosamine--fructose-6-phosphate aminotransferase (isomerizing)
MSATTGVTFHLFSPPLSLESKAVVFFPRSMTTLHCGLAGLITVYNAPKSQMVTELDEVETLAQSIRKKPLADCDPVSIDNDYMGGQTVLDNLAQLTRRLKSQDNFLTIYQSQQMQQQLGNIASKLGKFLATEVQALETQMGLMSTEAVELADQRVEKLKDIVWCLNTEITENILKVKELIEPSGIAPTSVVIKIFRNINAVLNSIDRLEVRGRDSAGISLMFLMATESVTELNDAWTKAGLAEDVKGRISRKVLANQCISAHTPDTDGMSGICFTYKVAAEIGSLGDNVRKLRQDIAEDAALHIITQHPHHSHTVSAHTRWASVGAITIANCHPVDNAVQSPHGKDQGIIHACLNGDIDNYLALKGQWENDDRKMPEEITTDTKIIPLQIEKYINDGHDITEAFRRAVNDFEGSHAITMHTDLAPGKFFLAQKGSGQAIFVGLAQDHYLPTSEVYGFVEETSRYLKLDGEKVIEGRDGSTQGQIFVLDQTKAGGLSGITAMYYDGTTLPLSESDIQETEITSRDIDRQDFPHYFLKEITEAPVSVAKTLQNRWKMDKDDPSLYTISLDEGTFPPKIEKALAADKIRRIYLIGQGTAGVAALAIADILDYYLNEPALKISALKASELSGFQLDESDSGQSMDDVLVIAISQSGTTTDTNRAVDMVRARGAYTMAIVNRRDSDITFKVDGVVYTSSGRDIEMSVASTKAFYSQIVAGALVALKVADTRGCRSSAFIAEEIKALLQLPEQMGNVLKLTDQIQASAQRLAPTKTYWAAVGSGPNKSAADEIRIKLSELCYKTISSDYVEDKKHIDLSSEPLIIICAAGSTPTVIGDIIKDTAIFKAHKATPVVIADEGDDRFAPYAKDIFYVPSVRAHLSPILNTLAGHLWGYFAALSINEGSRFLHQFREEIKTSVDQHANDGLDVYEVVLEKSFRERVARFYAQFRQKQQSGKLPSTIQHAADLLLLLKYLAGRLPVPDFELDFGKKGTALNMLNSLFEFLNKSINGMSRPVDAIKHQAKTVTVGTSRISEKIGGILFDALADHNISTAQLINRNILVLKNLQGIVGKINGSILYRIDNLNILGEPKEDTTIEVLQKNGVLEKIPSRVEADTTLKGTKRIIVRQGNVYIGKGRKDGRSILVIPAISTDPKASNRIEYLLLLNIGFLEEIDLSVKIKALGGKYEHIRNIIQENSIKWNDDYLELVAMDELFGRSAEKISEQIVAQIGAK